MLLEANLGLYNLYSSNVSRAKTTLPLALYVQYTHLHPSYKMGNGIQIFQNDPSLLIVFILFLLRRRHPVCGRIFYKHQFLRFYPEMSSLVATFLNLLKFFPFLKCFLRCLQIHGALPVYFLSQIDQLIFY